MIYLTGDFHGEKSRFDSKAIKKLKKNDTLIICGDFGFIWNGSEGEQKLLCWIGKRRYNVLFVEGTHDNLKLLGDYPTEEWSGGLTHHISGRLRHLVRGQRFVIEGVSILAMGGGQPDDNARPGIECWDGVLPTKDEVMAICDQMDSYSWQVDVVASHQAPTNIDGCFTRDLREINMLTALMNTIQRKNSFKVWCFGSYHQNRLVPPFYHGLYDEVYCAGGEKQGFFHKKKKQNKKNEA